MRWLFLFSTLMIINLQFSFGQQIELHFQLLDDITEIPISDAHVFVSGASIGTTSDALGMCKMNIPSQENQSIIISHLSYETLIINPNKYHTLKNGIPVLLKSNSMDLIEVSFTVKKSASWKKKYRKFKKAFLGEGVAASKCKILNPEVLRFEEKDGNFLASAIDILKIDNSYLGYEIQFLLDELSIDADGSRYYKGNGQFTDKPNLNNLHKKRREEIYQNSLAHFLNSLLLSLDKASLKNNGFQISIDQYSQGAFTKISTPEPHDLIQADTISGFYQLHFPQFLTIHHLNLKDDSASGYQMPISNAEQQKFGVTPSVDMEKGEQFIVSRLFKIKSYLIFDIRGNIINKSAVKEYDFWANQRLATTLPINYKNFEDFEIPHISSTSTTIDTLVIFKQFIGIDPIKKEEAKKQLQENWSDHFIAPLLDILRLSNDDWHQKAIEELLVKNVPNISPNYFEGSQWLWKKNPNYGNYYADFKAHLYSAVDASFYAYFHNRNQQSDIRLDEIVWGGVKQDGIPPLHSPKMMKANDAQYLSDSDIVFGLEIDGIAYAYPKRILAWHEFFTDYLNGKSIAGVYCPLCGTVIIYDTEFKGVKHELGTSGFLYRSNKLMYDHATQSLWSTIQGKPVVGPLVNQNIELSILPVETTTWKEWNKKYPETQVLSLETGHKRNYDEGEAYKKYFASDQLMFPVPHQDNRLTNKARVLIPRTDNYPENPLAISIDYLKQKGFHQDKMGMQDILILTEENGASRIYAIDNQKFKSYKNGKLMDSKGGIWEITDASLSGPDRQHFKRIPAHEAFWFAWVNLFPETRLIKRE